MLFLDRACDSSDIKIYLEASHEKESMEDAA